MPKPVVVLLHWKESEIRELASRIHGCTVKRFVPVAGEGMKGLKAFGVPDAVVISLDRLPSHGRDVGYAFHLQKATRQTPLIYAGGSDPEKIQRIQALIPEARFTAWDTVSETIQHAIANPIETPARTSRVFSETPLPQKLALKPGMRIALLGAPAPLEKLIPGLPPNITIEESPGPGVDVTFWFLNPHDDAEFETDLPAIARALHATKPRLWVFYQKGKTRSWQRLQELAAPFALGQYKILRLDATWTGLAFGRARK